MIAVQVKDSKGRYITARALIDEGSASYISSLAFVRKLGFTGKPKQRSKDVVNGENMEKSERHQLNLLSRKGESLPCDIWTLQKLCESVVPYNWESIQDQYPHLKHLDLKIPPGSIDILIGLDHDDFVIPSKIRRGKSGEPYGTLTKLGWIVRGKVPVFERP